MTIMKYILFSVLLSTVLFAGEVTFSYFTTKSDGKDITVSWQPSTEKNVVRYEIERSADNQTFRTVATVEAKGTWANYNWIDQDVFMKQTQTQQNTITKGNFYYRLKIVYSDNTTTYSNSSAVVHNISSVRRTWGMIKEMFK